MPPLPLGVSLKLLLPLCDATLGELCVWTIWRDPEEGVPMWG